MDTVAETWRERVPESTGTYKRSIKKRSLSAHFSAGALRRGTAVGQVYSDDDPGKVAAIEFGTEDTPEIAPMRKTAARFD